MNLFIFLFVQSSAQQALMGTINTSMQAVQKAQIDLGEVDNLPPLGQDMVVYSAHTCVYSWYTAPTYTLSIYISW